MKVHHFAILFLFIFCISPVLSQNLDLTFRKSMRSIEAGNFIEVELPRPDDKKYKRYLLPTITGEFMSFDGEYLKMKVLESHEKIIVDGSDAGYHFRRYTDPEKGPLVEIPIRDIMSIKAKGKSNFQSEHPGDVIGNVLGGLTLFALTFTALGGKNDPLFTQIVLLTIISFAVVSLSFHQHRYMTNVNSHYFRGYKRVWTINPSIKSRGA